MSPRVALAWKVGIVLFICAVLLLTFRARNESIIPYTPIGHAPAHVSTSKPEPTPENTTSATPEHTPIETPAISKPQTQSGQPDQPRPPMIKPYGHTDCLPPFDEQLLEESAAWSNSCREYSPFTTGPKRVAHVSITFGDRKPFVERAYRNHMLHTLVHRQDMHVMCDAIVDHMWNKQAFMLKILYDQMLLPEEDRYDWLFWADRDTLILDPCRPASSFLPPGNSTPPGQKEIHLIANEDANGLNAGVFFLRVSAWSVTFLEAVLAFRNFKPDVQLLFAEQSAMAELLKTPEFEDNKVYMPWWWFNAYPDSEDNHGPASFVYADDAGLKDYQARRGDFLVHFAGDYAKEDPIDRWEDALEDIENAWEMGNVLRDVSKEIRKFWSEKGYTY